MMEKPVVFISHIREEAVVARAFKEEIEQRFLGLTDVFVSSDEDSVPLGQNWLDRVTTGLRTAKAMLIVCSPVSRKDTRRFLHSCSKTGLEGTCNCYRANC